MVDMRQHPAGSNSGHQIPSLASAPPAGARLIALEDGSRTLPGAVFRGAEGRARLFGRAAITAYVGRDGGRLMRGLKGSSGSSRNAGKTRDGSRVLSFLQGLDRVFDPLRAQRAAATVGSLRPVVPGRRCISGTAVWPALPQRGRCRGRAIA
jgi:hypothetical chaperone protein